MRVGVVDCRSRGALNGTKNLAGVLHRPDPGVLKVGPYIWWKPGPDSRDCKTSQRLELSHSKSLSGQFHELPLPTRNEKIPSLWTEFPIISTSNNGYMRATSPLNNTRSPPNAYDAHCLACDPSDVLCAVSRGWADLKPCSPYRS